MFIIPHYIKKSTRGLLQTLHSSRSDKKLLSSIFNNTSNMSVKDDSIRVIKEGKAEMQVPKTVFYNPVQEFNRDLSVLVLRTYLKHNVWHHKGEEKHVTNRAGMKILDALSASGLRSIRYAKELGPSGDIVKEIVANDLSDAAVDLIKKNIQFNNVSDKVTCSHSDAAMLLYNSSTSYDERFHVIDLDPFGSCAQFFNAAVKSIGEAGLLMITCTDTAVLCGNASESCFARYGSMSLRADYCHEAALRIILRTVESHAAVHGRYIKPLLSLSVDFYVRLFVQVFSQQSETKKSASKLSQVYQCRQCKTTELNPLGQVQIKEDAKQASSQNDAVKYRYKPAEFVVGDSCRICGGSFNLGGPIWNQAIHDANFLNLLKLELDIPETKEEFTTFRRIQGLVHMCSEELKEPLFFGIDSMSSILRMKMPRQRDLFSALINAGYQVSISHTNSRSIKTDAPSPVVWDIFCQLAEQQKIETKDPLAIRIMSRTREKKYSFEENSAAYPESKKLSLLRYQVNPTKYWGPKSRPISSSAAAAMVEKHHETTSDRSKDTKKCVPVDNDSKENSLAIDDEKVAAKRQKVAEKMDGEQEERELK